MASNAVESESTVGPDIYCAEVTYLKISPSKASAWVDCPRRYFHSYVERRRPGRMWAHFSFGNSVHAALREWFDLPREQRTGSEVDRLVTRVWINAGFRDEEQSDEWRVQAAQMVARYVARLDPDFQPLSVERTLAFKADRCIVQGRIDRVDSHDQGAAVIDYKTGKSIPTPDDVRGSGALAMYALMVQRALGQPCWEVSLHHLPSGNDVTWTHTGDSLQRHLDRVYQIAQDILLAQDTWEAMDELPDQESLRDELFPTRPSGLCGFCDHWDVCEVGRSYTERKESWAGLALGVA